jgi:preprotein translocase subunit SecY
MIISAICAAFEINFTSIAFTGTSLLIVVGVALETVRDLEAQLAMRNYKGFLD